MVTVHRGIPRWWSRRSDEEEDIDKKGAYLHFEIKAVHGYTGLQLEI